MPPAPGMMASRVSGRPTTAELPKTRRCVLRASSRPPPRASEASAVRVGMGSVARRVRVWRRVVRKLAVLFGWEGECVSFFCGCHAIA